MPLNNWSVTCRRIAYKQLLINKSIFKLIINFFINNQKTTVLKESLQNLK
jgi:hypothetical protein